MPCQAQFDLHSLGKTKGHGALLLMRREPASPALFPPSVSVMFVSRVDVVDRHEEEVAEDETISCLVSVAEHTCSWDMAKLVSAEASWHVPAQKAHHLLKKHGLGR